MKIFANVYIIMVMINVILVSRSESLCKAQIMHREGDL